MSRRAFIPIALGFALGVFFVGCKWIAPVEFESAPAGTIESDEVRIASRYGGRVQNIFAKEGDTLAAGAPILELDAAELTARRDYTAALLDELVNGPRPEEIRTARAEWEAIISDLEFARADDKRTRELFASRTVSASERDRAASRVATLDKQAAAAKSRLDLLNAGTRPERITQVRAQLAEIDAQLRETRINAPANCVLEVLSVKVGDVLAANREAATLLLTDRLWVRVFVPETWLTHLKIGQKVSVITDPPARKTFSGAIEQISRAAEFTPRNVQTRDERIRQVFSVKIALPDTRGELRAGMTIEAEFPSVPDAIQHRSRPPKKSPPPAAAQ